ncbi:hypothetical protein N7535_008348 [Penicillium sp. DV-2018c]|nr:hypothetical protein N7461_002104 [Penicillium sp. DV-2018c]KAJ5563184.1 hypothetical protein N7535_008348 [Penicillium sp. DV-2018c]
MKWSPCSPDLNPIEHAGSASELKEHFSNSIDRAWEELGQNYDKLVRTMNRRVEAVVSSQGWYTTH